MSTHKVTERQNESIDREATIPIPEKRTPKRALPAPAQDEEIFAFFRKYVGLLTAAGALPLLTSALNVLPLPPKAEKLNVISSLCCVIVLGVCILFKNWFTGMAVANKSALRGIPSILALGILGVGVYLTATYLADLRVEETSDRWSVVLIYLSIFPCYVAGLGIVLMASYAEFYGNALEQRLDQLQLSAEEHLHVKNILEDCATLFRAPMETKVREFCLELVTRIDSDLKELSQGVVEVLGPEMHFLNRVLWRSFPRSFYAVSDRDLNFWLNSFRDDGTEHIIAREYLRLNIDAVTQHKAAVTRILIFSVHDIRTYEAEIQTVLERHHDAGIGWALIVHEELPSLLKNDSQALDFALFDGDAAMSRFVNYREDRRMLRVTLQVPSHRKEIESYVARHRELVGQCWIASERFCEIHRTREQAREIKKLSLDDAEDQMKKDGSPLSFNRNWVVEVKKNTEIGRALQFVRSLRKWYALYWNEYSSPLAPELEGSWTYAVKGQNQDGESYTHTGRCDARMERANVIFEGVREETKTESNGIQKRTRSNIAWKSSPVEFRGESMEFKYHISINGKDVLGICRFKFSPDDKAGAGVEHMSGEVFLIEETAAQHTETKLVLATIDFARVKTNAAGFSRRRTPLPDTVHPPGGMKSPTEKMQVAIDVRTESNVPAL